MWNKPIECMDREMLRKQQLESLRKTVNRVYQHVPYYREKMQLRGIAPADIRSLEDIKHLPFTDKTDLRDNYPFGLFAEPMDNIVRIHASSGTTGKPTVVGYTAADIDMWSEVMARSLGCAGATKGSIVQVSYGYGLFTGGLGAHYGAERMGASVIPMSGGNTRRQLMLMEDFGATILCCTPSYALMLGEALREAGVGRDRLKLKAGVFGAEPWTEGMRNEIEALMGIDALDVYGLSEITGPGVGIECMEKSGLHIWEDHFYPEIVNPDTGEPVPDGEKGELVITTLTKEGIPMLRYRTHDVSSIIPEERCPCGRTHRRIKKLMGRTDDMLIIRGVNVFPSQVEGVLVGIEGIAPHYVLIVDRVNNADVLEVMVELSGELLSDEVRVLEALQKRVAHEIYTVLGINVNVRLVSPKTIERSEGKAKRVIDKRNLV